MKFIVKQNDLKEALNKLARVASKQISVYKNVKIEKLSNDRILLSATNGVISLKIKLEAIDVDGESIAIDARKFNDIINKLDGSITFNDGVISANKSKIKLEITAAEFEVQSEDINEASCYNMPVDFINQLKTKIFATNKDGVLSGISLKDKEICATNRNLLALQTIAQQIDKPVILSTDFALELNSCIEGDFDLYITSQKAVAKTENTTLIGALINSNFPNYNAILPTNYEKSFAIDKALLIKSLELMLLLKGVESVACRFKISENQLMLESRSNNNEGSSTLDIDYSGENIEFALNTEYVISALNSLDSDVIVFKFENDSKPVIITDDNSNTILIMPMRVR